VFYRDYSEDPNCFGLKKLIDPLIQIHEQLAQGGTQQRWRDGGVFAFERMGGGHLLVGLNKDVNASRTITVQTGFPPNTRLQEFTGHGADVTTQSNSQVNIVIPNNSNGGGYVCYARPAQLKASSPTSHGTTQEYEGAADLDIKPAVENERVQVCRIFAEANTHLQVHLSFDATHWTQGTSIRLEIETEQGQTLISSKFGQAGSNGVLIDAKTTSKGFYSIFVISTNTPAGNKAPKYKAAVSYTAPQTD
jgi:alpha-amylase